MRVVEVHASGERGGGAEHIANLVPELARLGIELVAVVGPTGPLAARLTEAGVPVEPVDMMTARLDRAAVRSLGGKLRSLGADLVHAHGTRSATYAVLARPAAPIVYTAHGLSYRRTGDPVGRLIRFGTEAVLCHRAAAVITVSSMDLRDLRRRRVLRASKGVHIGNGIRLERFAGGDRRAARMRLGIDEDAFVVGSVTRLVPEKAVADLVDAVLELPSAVLVVVGEGPLQRDLVARARPAGGRIRFVGSRDDVPDILPAFDVFALSSLWEGEPIALLEAMAAGLPCVATRTSGARELLEGGQLGILTKVGQPSEMASVIETLRLDPDERERLAQAARVSVGGRSWASVAARVADVYTSVLADDHGPSKVDG